MEIVPISSLVVRVEEKGCDSVQIVVLKDVRVTFPGATPVALHDNHAFCIMACIGFFTRCTTLKEVLLTIYCQ
jgi:hypothetical protein